MSHFKFPLVRYADAEGVRIAYEVRGGGARDLVRVSGSMSSVLAAYLDPVAEAHYDQLAGFTRLISFDRRGTGLSDPLREGAAPPLEQRVADVVGVMDAVESRRAVLYSTVGDGGQVAILCAAMHPERVEALVLTNAWARMVRTHDYPFGLEPNGAQARMSAIQASWGDVDRPFGFDHFAPSRCDEVGFRAVLARVQQASVSPALASITLVNDTDVRDVLPLVQAPTLIAFPRESSGMADHARFLSERIPNARLASFPGGDTYFGRQTPERTAIIEEFVTGTRPAPVSDRVLATVMFTDIVASTERVATVGDRQWREQLDRHDEMVRAQLRLFRGREISTAGDSFFATFDGPARAIRCAQRVIEEAGAAGIDVRAGVHTGECEVRGDDYGGIAVHIGARVAALAGPAQVLATSTVKDLVAGSGISFLDRSSHSLKGIPDPWHLYEVE